MQRNTCLKAILSLALLLSWGPGAGLVTAQNRDWLVVESVSPPQTIPVRTPRGAYTAVFQSGAQVFPDGIARGTLHLQPLGVDPDDPNIVYIGGTADFARDGSVKRVVLRGRTAAGALVIVVATPVPSEECVVYDLVGPGVRASWEAQGRITVVRR